MAGLAGGLGGIVYFSLSPDASQLSLTQGHILAAVVAGLVLHMHNILPLMAMITIRKGRNFWLYWAESYIIEAVVEGMLLSLGLIAALLATQATKATIVGSSQSNDLSGSNGPETAAPAATAIAATTVANM